MLATGAGEKATKYINAISSITPYIAAEVISIHTSVMMSYLLHDVIGCAYITCVHSVRAYRGVRTGACVQGCTYGLFGGIQPRTLGILPFSENGPCVGCSIL